MTTLQAQFLLESRDFLQEIGEKLMQLERQQEDRALISELFRLVHTLKGNSGLFNYPEMTSVLHAAEDLMDSIRQGDKVFNSAIADALLDAMDFVGQQLDDIEGTGYQGSAYRDSCNTITQQLRKQLSEGDAETSAADANSTGQNAAHPEDAPPPIFDIEHIPLELRHALYDDKTQTAPFYLVRYTPEAGCFFKGEDPFFHARNTPDIIWGAASLLDDTLDMKTLDVFQSNTVFMAVSRASLAELKDYFRYVDDQIEFQEVHTDTLLPPAVPAEVTPRQDALHDALHDAREETSSEHSQSQDATNQSAQNHAPPANTTPDTSNVLNHLLVSQLDVLSIEDDSPWAAGRLLSVIQLLLAAYRNNADVSASLTDMQSALNAEEQTNSLRQQLHDFVQTLLTDNANEAPVSEASTDAQTAPCRSSETSTVETGTSEKIDTSKTADEPKHQILKVDQAKVDRLVNLIGEMVVAKNGLPYLANRAENGDNGRELAKDLKAQYMVINRITEEMQDVIMQVRMMPVSFVFQRFPRLVRDLARKLGKDVELVIEGQETEADKNIIEAIADPLIHIVRNSLDHGLETPEERSAAGKPSKGTLKISAHQDSDRACIEIRDDGRGIDPQRIKQKAYEKKIIDEIQLEKLPDKEALKLIFAPGFSTAEKITDLSGRGVGMDVVRTAIENVGGVVHLDSELGKGTTLRLELPLSMAVTNVMVVRADDQIYGLPMDLIVETVRLPASAISSIKHRKTAVLRGRIIPILSLNSIMASPHEPIKNDDDEFAIIVVRVYGEALGVIVDDFQEVIDIILKPLPGDLAQMELYSGSALLGDGSVLLVLNPKEFIHEH